MPAPGPFAGSQVPDRSRIGAGPAALPPASGFLTGLPQPSTTVRSAVDWTPRPPPPAPRPCPPPCACPLPPWASPTA